MNIKIFFKKDVLKYKLVQKYHKIIIRKTLYKKYHIFYIIID
jgi:hypothetical protein